MILAALCSVSMWHYWCMESSTTLSQHCPLRKQTHSTHVSILDTRKSKCELNQVLGAMIHKIYVVSLLLMFVRTPVSHSHHFPSRESRTTCNMQSDLVFLRLGSEYFVTLLGCWGSHIVFSFLGLCRDIDFLLEAAILSYSPVSIDWHCSLWQE